MGRRWWTPLHGCCSAGASPARHGTACTPHGTARHGLCLMVPPVLCCAVLQVIQERSFIYPQPQPLRSHALVPPASFMKTCFAGQEPPFAVRLQIQLNDVLPAEVGWWALGHALRMQDDPTSLAWGGGPGSGGEGGRVMGCG